MQPLTQPTISRPEGTKEEHPRIANALAEALSESISDWKDVIEFPLTVLALFAFVAATLSQPLSAIVGHIITFYRLFTSIFDVVEYLWLVDIPDRTRDILVFWVLTGLIGARTTIKLNKKMFALADQALATWLSAPPAVRRRLEESHGKSWVDQEVKFLTERRTFHEITRERRRILYVGCVLTGPLFFLRILWVNPSMPGFTTLTGRYVVFIEVTAIVVAFFVLYALNWSTL